MNRKSINENKIAFLLACLIVIINKDYYYTPNIITTALLIASCLIIPFITLRYVILAIKFYRE